MPTIKFAEAAERRKWARRLTGPLDESAFEATARELFAWQFARVPAYRRLCLAHEITPDRLKSWREIPAVPQQLFKLETLFAFGKKAPGATYETSGTTTGQPGRQLLLHPDIYQAVSTEGARQIGLLETQELHFLTPAPGEAPHSSLSTMFGFWRKANRKAASRFWVRQGRFDFEGLRVALENAIQAGRPIGVAGTAFSFVHLIDAWADRPSLALPPGSWVLETGGFKGRSREVPKAELYGEMARLFQVADADIWNEYGMSELSSQAYARGTSGWHTVPGWARVLVCDPVTGREVGVGRPGLIRWFDLANTDSVLALQTLDLAERTPGGFRIMGRLPRTEPRGCSLSVEDIAALGSRERAS